MSHADLVSFFLALGVLLGTARILGEIARRFNQPAVMGELLAGILLGPTILGSFAPGLTAVVFPATPGFATALQSLTAVAITLFLLVAGIEVDLSSIFRQGRLALSVAVGGILLPFAVGFLSGWTGPQLFGPSAFGVGESGSPLVFALFIATTLSISALPVIAKTLMDLNLYRSELGMTVIAAAVINDLIGWVIFAVLLGMMGAEAGSEQMFPIGWTIGLTLAFVLVMLTIGRSLMHRALPFIQAHASWPGGVLGFAVVLALLGAAFTEWIGIHAIFGSFIVGVAFGDSSHLKERTRQTLESFVTFIFAPLFFASVGLKIDFVANFDWLLVLFVIVIACVGKLVGCGLAARWSGIPWRESVAIGAAMNARGAMEIILALLALEAQLINERLFVALVVMALATSVVAGPIMQAILRRTKPQRFTDYLGPRAFLAKLPATDRFGAMEALCRASGASGLSMDQVIEDTVTRERLMPTGIGNGIALSQVRLSNLNRPQVALAISSQGIDFDSPDGEPCHVVCLILTSDKDLGLGLDLYRDAAATLLDKSLRKRLANVKSYTEFLALLAEFRGHGTHSSIPAAAPIDRANVIIVGATATARAIAKLLSQSQPVVLVDSNASHVEESKRDGLMAVFGNALDIEVLTEAHARSAKVGLMMTANSQINAIAARQLRELFQVPQLAVVQEQSALIDDASKLLPLEVARLFDAPVLLNDWDHWFTQGEVVIERVKITGDEPVTSQIERIQGESKLVLAIARSSEEGHISPFTSHSDCGVDDELLVGIVPALGSPRIDRFDHLVSHCTILDIREELDQVSFFDRVATILGAARHEPPEQITRALLDRESRSSTVLTSGLAVPHISLGGEKCFEMLVARCHGGVRFNPSSEPIKAIFVLASTTDERNFHLKALAAIVQISQSPRFMAKWLEAADENALRRLLLDSPRQRMH